MIFEGNIAVILVCNIEILVIIDGSILILYIDRDLFS